MKSIAKPQAWGRRGFLGRCSGILGLAALSQMQKASRSLGNDRDTPVVPKAKRIIYLFQSGAPSQLDLFDTNRNSRSGRTPTCPNRSARASG